MNSQNAKLAKLFVRGEKVSKGRSMGMRISYLHCRVRDLNEMMLFAYPTMMGRYFWDNCAIRNIGNTTGGGTDRQAVYYLPYKGRALLRKVIKRNKWENDNERD